MGRYEKNIGTLTPKENERIRDARVCVVGCGGLGGYVIEMLARLGVGFLTVADGDSFEESNLNRQILSAPSLLGKNKVLTAMERVNLINPSVQVSAIDCRLNGDNAKEILAGHSLVVDALDDISARFILQEAAEELGIVMIHAAVEEWRGQITTIFPGDRSLYQIYDDTLGYQRKATNAAFTPAFMAALQVSEAVKVLIGRGGVLRKIVLYADLLEQEYRHIYLD